MLKFMLDGGPLMWVLLALSITGLAVIIDRWKVFKLAARDTSGMRSQIMEKLEAGQVDEAVEVCRSTRGPVAAVLLNGLARYRSLLRLGQSGGKLDESVSQSMEDYAPHVISALGKRVNLLLMIGSISPLVGMTGTVTGMIKAFQEMALGGLSGEAVAGGISEALITTATGLLLAVPAVVFYNIFSNKLEQYTLEIEESASELVEFIHLRNVSAGPV